VARVWNLFLTNCLGRERKLHGPAKRWADYACTAHDICLPPFLPVGFKEQAGRTQGLHNLVSHQPPVQILRMHSFTPHLKVSRVQSTYLASQLM
jgi:hypothetical protein